MSFEEIWLEKYKKATEENYNVSILKGIIFHQGVTKAKTLCQECYNAGWNAAIEEIADKLPCNRITCAVIDHETKHHFSCPQYWADEIRKIKVE